MSEKVKEIKKALEYCSNHSVSDCSNVCPYDKYTRCRTELTKDSLTLINELESENEMLRLERDVLIGKKIVEKQKHDKAIIMKIDIQKQLKNRIAELEKENETKTDTIANLLKNQEFYETEKLKQFAEKLKKRLNLGLYEWQYAEVDSKTIDEVLKEYIDEE